MRQRIAILLTAIITAASTQAQLSFGIRSGVSWSNVDFPKAEEWDSKSRLAPSVGAMFHIALSDRIGLQPEVAYVSRGFRQELAQTANGPVGSRFVFEFIDCNALLVLHLAQEPARPHLIFGPSVGMMTGARVLAETDGTVSGGSVLDPVKLRLNRTVMGLCAGAGFTFTTGASRLVIEGRYAYGLTDIWNGLPLVDINGVTIREVSGYDRSFSLHLAWLMPLPKRTWNDNGEQ